MTRARFPLALFASFLALPASTAAAGALRGAVVIDGKPAPAAVASAIPFEEPHARARRQARGEAEPGALASATADARGAFVLTVSPVPGKEILFRVRIAAKGAVTAELSGVYDASETGDLGEQPLRKAGALAGRVAGPGGAPVAGARVTLTARGRFDVSSGLTPVVQETRTGADGTYRFESAAPERNELVVEAEGFATARVAAAKGGALGRAIALVEAAAVSGSVKKRDGTPAVGVLVRYEADGLETRWVETGADGAFRLADAPRRRGSIVADAGDGGFAETSVTPGPGGAPLVLVLAPPTVLEGRTLDVATLRTVPRVKLEVTADEGIRVARSGADGRFRVRGLRPGEVHVRADEPQHVLWTRARVLLEKGTTKVLDIPLTRGASLSGRIVDEDGRPVPDATVLVSSGEESPFSFAMRAMAGDPAATIRSRADGIFSAARLAPGENQRLTVRHPDYEKGTLGGISLVAGGARTGAVVTLRRGLVLAGRVEDPDGNPIAGAELGLSQSRAVRSSRGGMRIQMAFGGVSDAPTGKSGPDGRFELKGIPAGDWALTAKAPGRATEIVDPLKLARDVRPDPIAIVLSPGAAIGGSVLRRTGGGAEGYFVIARPSGGPPAGGLGPDALPTGPDGAFFLDGLKAGETYDLQLFGGLAFIGPGPTKKGIVAPAADVEWIVEGTGRIEGVAVDARTGQPLPSFEVSYQVDRPGLGGGGVMRMGRRAGGLSLGGAGEAILVEAPDGRFALEDVPAGKWQVVVTAKGYQAARAGGVLVEEAATTEGVEVRVPPGSTLKGRVTDARSGRAVPEASVSVSADAVPAFPGFSPFSGLVTDVDGRFEVEGLAPGKVTVSVEHPEYTERSESVELKEGGSSVGVALSRGSSLGGVVLTEARQPAAGAEVALEGSGSPGRGFGGGESSASDASGRFRFDHLSPGRYSLRASIPGQTTEPVEAVVVAGESNGDVTLVLAGGATIRGAVSGLPDVSLASVNVSASGPREFWASARTGADGRFELAGAPAGTISLRATAGDFLAGTTRSANGSVTIAEGQKEAEADIVFEGNGTLSGRVTRGGQPVAEARVFVGASRGNASASGRTDEGGSYRIEGITPGDYTVSVQSAVGGGGRAVTKELRIDGAASLDFELPLARLSGSVVDGATKQPLPDARVTANPDGAAAGRPGIATTDSNGRFFVDDVEPGPYSLTLRRSGYQEARGNASATEEGGDAGTIEMTRGEGLELRVSDGIYRIPIRSANVRVKDGTGANVTSTWLALDGDGKGEIASLRPGRYTLVVGSGGYATQVLDGVVVPGAPLPVGLTPGGSVEIRAGEASRAKGVATLLNGLGQPHPYRSWGAEGRVVLPGTGTEVLENLAPGSYTLAVEGVAPKGLTVTEGGRTLVELP